MNYGSIESGQPVFINQLQTPSDWPDAQCSTLLSNRCALVHGVVNGPVRELNFCHGNTDGRYVFCEPVFSVTLASGKTAVFCASEIMAISNNLVELYQVWYGGPLRFADLEQAVLFATANGARAPERVTCLVLSDGRTVRVDLDDVVPLCRSVDEANKLIARSHPALGDHAGWGE